MEVADRDEGHERSSARFGRFELECTSLNCRELISPRRRLDVVDEGGLLTVGDDKR